MAQPKLIESPEKFLEVLEKSGLLKPEHMAAVKASELASSDPITIAKALLKRQLLTRWQAQQLLSGYFNLTFGKYVLRDQLGRGELGTVYLAENPKLGRKVALKTLSKKYINAPELVQRFLDEARAAAKLDHPNIIHVHDVSSEGDRHLVVMEYVDGQDLQARIEAGAVADFEQAVDYVRQAAEGMKCAHEQEVKHLDLKPANLMVDKDGTVKILDIGVGHLRQTADEPAANTGELMISANAYMAPEQARGDNVDARADIYSLGATLYFLLTGRAPFAADNDDERATVKETRRPLPIADLRSDVPADLAALCDKMMASQPGDRHVSMSAVLDSLRDWKSVQETAAVVEVAEPTSEAIAVAATPAPAAGGISIDVGASGPSAGGNFSINTKRRKKKKAEKKPVAAATTPPQRPTKPAPEEEEAQAEEAAVNETAVAETLPQSADPVEELQAIPDAEPATEPAQEAVEPAGPKKAIPMALIIGGACAAGLMLLITGVAVGVLLFGGGGEAVVQAPTAPATGDAQDAAEATAAEAAAQENSADAQSGGDGSAEDSAGGPTPETNDGAIAGAASKEGTPDPPTASGVETTEVTTTTETPEATPADPGNAKVTAAEPTPPPTATTTPPTPAPPATDPPAETTPKPADPPEKMKKKADEAPKKKEPEKKKAPTKKAPPPKTFVFAPAVDLPAVATDAPETTLGKVNVGPDELVFISLTGGETAFNSRTEFTLLNAQDGVAPRDWEFFVTEGTGDPVVIATMSMPEKELKFKWAAAASDSSAATNLRNCSLKVTAGQAEPAQVALRTPQKIPAVAINLDKSATAKWLIEGPPDRSSLRMEITVNGHKASVEPPQMSLEKGGIAAVYFGENKNQAALMLKVTASATTKQVLVKMEPMYLIPGQPRPERYTKVTLKKVPQQLQQKLQGSQGFLLQVQEAAKNAKTKRQADAALPGAIQNVELLTKAIAHMEKLRTDVAAVTGNVTLQVRVFAETFDKPIDLMVPDPEASPIDPK